MQEVSEDRFRATTTFKRKILQEVGDDKYLGDRQFRVRLPGREHADGKAVLAIVRDRREEEVQLLLHSFEVPYSPPAATGDADVHSDDSSEPE
jgi:hypothetical protein